MSDSVEEIRVGVLGRAGVTTYTVPSNKKVTVAVPSNVETGFLVVATKGKQPNVGIVIPIISPR